MKKRCKLPNYAGERSAANLIFYNELDQYLAESSVWNARNAMIGVLTGEGVLVKRSRGTQRFIEFHQNGNQFIFPIREVIALFFSKRLIVFSPSLHPYSGHFLLNYALSTGITFSSIVSYSLLSVFAVCYRKPTAVIEKKDGKRAFGPKHRSVENELFPPTHRIKTPGDHGLPEIGMLSIPGQQPLDGRDGQWVIRSIAFKVYVKASGGPMLNTYLPG